MKNNIQKEMMSMQKTVHGNLHELFSGTVNTWNSLFQTMQKESTVEVPKGILERTSVFQNGSKKEAISFIQWNKVTFLLVKETKDLFALYKLKHVPFSEEFHIKEETPIFYIQKQEPSSSNQEEVIHSYFEMKSFYQWIAAIEEKLIGNPHVQTHELFEKTEEEISNQFQNIFKNKQNEMISLFYDLKKSKKPISKGNVTCYFEEKTGQTNYDRKEYLVFEEENKKSIVVFNLLQVKREGYASDWKHILFYPSLTKNESPSNWVTRYSHMNNHLYEVDLVGIDHYDYEEKQEKTFKRERYGTSEEIFHFSELENMLQVFETCIE